MIRTKKILLILCILYLPRLVSGIDSPFSHSFSDPPLPGVRVIKNDYEAGIIDEREKRLFLFYYLKGDQRLPERYRIYGKDESPIQFLCPTAILMDILNEPSPLTEMEKREIRSWLDSFIKDGGVRMDSHGEEPSTSYLRDEKCACGEAPYNHYESDNFIVEWSSTSGADETDASNLSDYLETSWKTLIEDEGYRKPDLTDRYLLRVYIEQIGYQGGYTATSDPYCPEMVYIVIDPSCFTGNFIQDVAAHEFYHTIQFGYKTLYSSGWYWEASAVWSQDIVFPDNNNYPFYLSAYTDAPYERIDIEDGSHEYGMFIFPLYLEEYRGGTSTIKELWEISEGDTYTTIMENVNRVLSPFTFEDIVKEFSAVNATMDYSEGYLYSRVATSNQHGYYPVMDEAVDENRPRTYGSNFIYFLAIDIDPSHTRFNVKFTGDKDYNATPIEWGAFIVKVQDDNDTNAIRVEIPLENGTEGEMGFNGFGVKFDAAFLVVTLLTEVTVTDEGPSYTYSVELTEEIPEEEEGSGGCGGGYPGNPALGTPGGCSISTVDLKGSFIISLLFPLLLLSLLLIKTQTR